MHHDSVPVVILLVVSRHFVSFVYVYREGNA
jgi:hypothetical protein